MKPQSHFLTGIPIGLLVGIHDSGQNLALILGATIAGAIAPDIPTSLQLLEDKIRHRKNFSKEGDPNFEQTAWFLLKDMSHSPLAWIMLLVASHFIRSPDLLHMMLLGCGYGLLSHWIIDLATHCDDAFRRTDQTLSWPFWHLISDGKPNTIPKLGNWFGKHVVNLEYRIDYEHLDKTKLSEAIWRVLIVVTAIGLAVYHGIN
ncbi:MAG: metal-dependent hydrolase [Patescibacteria group bacterium]